MWQGREVAVLRSGLFTSVGLRSSPPTKKTESSFENVRFKWQYPDWRMLPGFPIVLVQQVPVQVHHRVKPRSTWTCNSHKSPLAYLCVHLFFQARFDAGELITQRELVSRQVSEDLTERAATFGLILDDVSLVRSLPFPDVLSRENWPEAGGKDLLMSSGRAPKCDEQKL